MLSLFLAAAIANVAADGPSPAAVTVSARAVVRIVRTTEIRFGRMKPIEEGVERKTTIRESDGSTRDASLIEFY